MNRMGWKFAASPSAIAPGGPLLLMAPSASADPKGTSQRGFDGTSGDESDS